ncbi:beta-lactamase family protein [Niastella caeni]|uniref:Beta-lactamase family protein n=1 Tax=Niastella caeni TaxID=2569763 RepID=A0A4S8HT04_9BACT|nr:serine hydrolase domain-containing protein [Niastella caeni]THU38141.1 beta-lactamase family protein [Niastella caeni]
MGKQIRFGLIFLLFTNILFAQTNFKKVAKSWQDSISKIARAEIIETGTPSLQIAIGLKGKIIYENAFGFADIENNIKATIETKYRTASVAKWWTSTLTMMLVNNSKLDLDIPIQRYCQHYPQKNWDITTRQILTHTSGIRHYADYDAELSKAKSQADTIEINKRRYPDLLGMFTRYTDMTNPLNNFKQDSLLFKPGSSWEYSSNGYRVLGCIIEGASGLSYRAMIKNQIFDKAGMTNTVEDDAWAIIPKRASGYLIKDKKEIRRADMRDVSENLPAGGFLSTSSDLVRFAMSFVSGKFVDMETIKKMTTPYIMKDTLKSVSTWRDAIPSKQKYGYGVMLFNDNETIKFGHNGRQDGGSAIVYYVPEKDLTIAVMTNAKGWNGFISLTKKIEKVITKIDIENSIDSKQNKLRTTNR